MAMIWAASKPGSSLVLAGTSIPTRRMRCTNPFDPAAIAQYATRVLVLRTDRELGCMAGRMSPC
jgi:hypothetical protein